MSVEEYAPAATRLLQYSVASSDMYFSEFQEREVWLSLDERGHIRLWGACCDQPLHSIGLCRVLLEYAMYCRSWCRDDEALFRVHDLGQQLGGRLAAYARAHAELFAADDPLTAIVEQILDAVGAGYSEEHVERGVRFLISDCPVEAEAQDSGLHEIELARAGLYALCRTLLQDLNSTAVVSTAPAQAPEIMFTVNAPGFG